MYFVPSQHKKEIIDIFRKLFTYKFVILIKLICQAEVNDSNIVRDIAILVKQFQQTLL